MVPDLSIETSLQLVTSELEKLRQTIEAISKINEKYSEKIININYENLVENFQAEVKKILLKPSKKEAHKGK